MRLVRQTDLALRLLMYLAANPDAPGTIARIAMHYDISRGHLMKVANLLGRSGFIETMRGRSGGLRLARPAAQIGIGAVVRQMEADFALVECQQPGGQCLLAGCCRLDHIMAEAVAAFLAILDRYTLDDLGRGNGALDALLKEVA